MLVTDAPPKTGRRREIEEWHSSLATLTDAEILQIPAGATPAQLKAAFASLARRFHPDSVAAGQDDLRHQLQSIFIRVTEAYRNLGRERSSTPASAAPAPVSPSLQDTAVRRARVEEALQTAEGLMLQQQTEEAVSVLHEVLTQADAPQRRRIRLLLARAYAVDARWRRNAVALLRELVEQNSNDAEALAALGGLYRRDGLLSRAESMFVRALAADPGLAEARQGMRSVRSALLAKHTPSRTKPAPRRGLMSRLFLVTR
jgi:tetratricopeptide (TPR) repeat protein